MPITFSALERLHHCPGSGVEEPTPDDSDDAAKGTARHEYLADLQDMSEKEALMRVAPEHKEMCSAIELETLPLGPPHRPEVAYALDVMTGEARCLGERLGRDYPDLGATWVFGTLDVERHDGVARVWDYKSGYDKTTPHASVNRQLRGCVTALARAHDLDRGEVALIKIKRGDPVIDGPHHLDALELDAAQDELLELVGRVLDAERLKAEGKATPLREGPWCRYCPAFLSCPLKAKKWAALVHTPEAVVDKILALLEQDPARGHEAMERATAVLKRVKVELYRIADNMGGIPLANGKKWGPHEVPHKSIDALKTLLAVREVFADWQDQEKVIAAALEAASLGTTSKAAIERGAKSLVSRGQGAEYTRRILKAVADAGGVTEGTRTKVEEYDP